MMRSLLRLHTRQQSRQASTIGTAVVLFVGVSVAVAPAAEAAAAQSSGGIYQMHVASSGLAVNIHDPNLVLQPDVALGPYAAAAALDSLGASTAVAGAPFLGDYVGPLVGHFNGLGSGRIPPFPPIPGAVQSSYPGQPSAVQRNGGYSIQAASTERESKAAVNLGMTTPGAQKATLFSVAHALADGNGALEAAGSAGVDLLNFGGVLDIGKVSSSVTMSQSGSEVPKFVTTTDVGTISVSGQKFGLDQDGLTAAGTSTGVSVDQLAEAAQALKQAGLSIRYIPSAVTYMPGTRTVRSMESGAVEISYQQEVPSQGLVTSTYTLGHVKLAAETPSGSSNVAQIHDARTSGRGAGSAIATTPRTAPRRASARSAADVVREASTGTTPANRAHEPQADAGDRSVAIITPTLRIMHFGATTGTPDTCNIFFGALGTGATQAGIAADGAPALSSAVDQCLTMSNAGGDQIAAVSPQFESLAPINPVVNPGIDAFADALERTGRDQAQAMAPFGPTVVGLADSARFFKGCEEC